MTRVLLVLFVLLMVGCGEDRNQCLNTYIEAHGAYKAVVHGELTTVHDDTIHSWELWMDGTQPKLRIKPRIQGSDKTIPRPSQSPLWNDCAVAALQGGCPLATHSFLKELMGHPDITTVWLFVDN